MVQTKVKRVTSAAPKTSSPNTTRLPLALKPTDTTLPLNSSANNVKLPSTTINTDTNLITATINQPSTSTSYSTLNNFASSPAPRTSEEMKLSSNAIKSKKRSGRIEKSKSILQTQVIKSQHFQEDSDAEAEYDLATCIHESGGVDKFLSTPCMILYKCNLTCQG